MMSRNKSGIAALLALGLLAQGVRASEMPGDDASINSSTQSMFTLSGELPGSQLVLGSTATVTTIHVNTAGTLSFTLTDKLFSSALESLSFAVTNATGTMASMGGSGTLSLDIVGPITLYADVFASAQGAANVGLYVMQVSFAPAVPVPVPASGLLLFAAIVAWQLKVRSIRPQRHNCHTAVA